MKQLFGRILILLIISAIYSCNDSVETNHTHESSDTVKNAPQENIGTYSKNFQNLVKTSEGVFRGLNLGASYSEVKTAESNTEMEEEGGGHLDYMVDYGELEEAEVSYNFNQYNKLSSIEVSVYPKSKQSQDSIFSEMEQYLTKKYGAPSIPTPNSRKWEYKAQNLFIYMEKKDTQKVHDINIRFSSLTKEMASILFEEDSLTNK